MTFDGFEQANTTPVPDILFDELLTELSGAELKVLLYIIRRTRGFKKETDAISFTQFLKGITTKDGKVLDKGCGMKSRCALSKILASLEKRGCITSTKGKTARDDNATTFYALRFREQVVSKEYHPSTQSVPPLVLNQYHPSTQNALPVVLSEYPQETVLQETVLQESITALPLEPPKAEKKTGIESNTSTKNMTYEHFQVVKSTATSPQKQSSGVDFNSQPVSSEKPLPEPLLFPVPSQPVSKRKPSPPKDESLQAKINDVYATFDKLLQEVSKDDDVKYAHTKVSTEAIKEFLSCKPSPEKLRMVYLDLWESPVSQNGFLWREHMSIAAICRNYTQRLASLRDKKRQETKPESDARKVGNYYIIG